MVHDLSEQAFVERVDSLHAERRSFYLSPSRWRSTKIATSLTWTEVPFAKKNQASIPELPGIYAFIIRHCESCFPPHGFIMYIGITGSQSHKRSLRVRYGDYLNEKTRNKRPRVHYMLNKYESDLYFGYVATPGTDVDLSSLEIQLNDAIIPPVGRKDFSAEFKALRDAIA